MVVILFLAVIAMLSMISLCVIANLGCIFIKTYIILGKLKNV